MESVGFEEIQPGITSFGWHGTGKVGDLYGIKKKQVDCIEVETFIPQTSIPLRKVWTLYRDLDLRPAILCEMCQLAKKYPQENWVAITFGTYFSPCVFRDPQEPVRILGMGHTKEGKRVMEWVDINTCLPADWRVVGVPGWLQPDNHPFS